MSAAECLLEKLTSFKANQRLIRAIRFNADGNYCLTCGADKSVKLWNPLTSILLKTYIGHGSEVLDAAGAVDNSTIISCSADKNVAMFDVASGQVVRKFRGHVGTVNCVAFNEESTVIFSGSVDTSVRLWDVKSRSPDPIQVLEEAKDSITSVCVSEHEIVTGSADGRIRRYDIRAGKLSTDTVGGTISCVSQTKDLQCILCSTVMDSTIRLFDKDTGEMLNEYSGHVNKSYKLDSCVNHDDSQILSGSEDGYIYVWSLIEASVVKRLNHRVSEAVQSISHHPTLPCLVSSSADKVFVWQSPESTAKAK